MIGWNCHTLQLRILFSVLTGFMERGSVHSYGHSIKLKELIFQSVMKLPVYERISFMFLPCEKLNYCI